MCFFSSPVTIKTVLIAFFMFVLQRTCGATMVQYYADSIFELSFSSIPPHVATVWIGVVSVVGSIFSILTVDYMGRRFLLTFSFFIMAVSMAVFVGYLLIITEGRFTIKISFYIRIWGAKPKVSIHNWKLFWQKFFQFWWTWDQNWFNFFPKILVFVELEELCVSYMISPPPLWITFLISRL